MPSSMRTRRKCVKASVAQAKKTRESKRIKANTTKKKREPSKSNKIPNVTLADIRRAAKADGKFIPKSELVRIPSQKTREEIYKEAASAIANREIVLLPTHGGRWWQCDVRVYEKKNTALPLFRWFRGALELACLPHIFERMQTEVDVYTYASEFALENRKASSISQSSIEFIPEIDRVWTSPLNEVFRTRKTVNEHTVELEKREHLINKVIYGFGKNEQELKPFKPTKSQAMEAGKYRFIRDGLWVMGQEEDWQEERAKTFGPTGRSISPLVCFISENRERFKKQRIIELTEQNETNEPLKFTLSHADKELRAKWKTLTDEDKEVWKKKAEEENIKRKESWSDTAPCKKSNRYILTPAQIDSCYSACISHYETIMHTVRARGLYHELADGGFDLLRERGRGRYDMTIPLFDNDPEFAFLASPDIFWMPVVRDILGGEKVTLVHKGCFMSLPGAEAQVYHQDGLHLNKKVQKPCHAVNVFIPLVDLNTKNGPTEFCLGTHLLGNENFNKEMVETPIVTAGTPIIFDYRLGHRGMGNTGNEPRPVLYLTYSTENKGFVDSVNFSKKRWRKIGDLVEMPLSREERSQRRNGRASSEN